MPLASTPSLAFLSALSGSTSQEPHAEPCATLDAGHPLGSPPGGSAAWEGPISLPAAAAPASQRTEAASTAAAPADEQRPATPLTGLPKRVRVLHSRCNSDLTAFNLSRGFSGIAPGGEGVPTNIITPVEMPLRQNNQHLPPALPDPASPSPALRSQSDSSLAWYITPEGVLTPVLPAPGAAWKGRVGPIPGVVYSALGRRRGRPRKTKPAVSQALPPLPPSVPSEPAAPAVPPAVVSQEEGDRIYRAPASSNLGGLLHSAQLLGAQAHHPSRSASLPKVWPMRSSCAAMPCPRNFLLRGPCCLLPGRG